MNIDMQKIIPMIKDNQAIVSCLLGDNEKLVRLGWGRDGERGNAGAT